MRHIRAKQYENPPAYITAKISPIDPIPEDSLICDYGIDTLSEGASSVSTLPPKCLPRNFSIAL